MCLAIPLKVIYIDGMEAVGTVNKINNKFRIDLVPKVKIGDYVMVHAGFAIEIMEEHLAETTIKTIAELEEALDGR